MNTFLNRLNALGQPLPAFPLIVGDLRVHLDGDAALLNGRLMTSDQLCGLAAAVAGQVIPQQARGGATVLDLLVTRVLAAGGTVRWLPDPTDTDNHFEALAVTLDGQTYLGTHEWQFSGSCGMYTAVTLDGQILGETCIYPEYGLNDTLPCVAAGTHPLRERLFSDVPRPSAPDLTAERTRAEQALADGQEDVTVSAALLRTLLGATNGPSMQF